MSCTVSWGRANLADMTQPARPRRDGSASLRIRRRRIERALERPALDYGVAAAVVGLLFVLARIYRSVDVLAALSPTQRADLYSKALGPLSIVASVATAGLAVYASGQGSRMSLLRAVHGPQLLKQFRGAAVAPGIAVVSLLVAYVADLGHSAGWARWLALGSALFVLLRAARVLYFYTGLLQTAGEDKDPEPALPSIDDDLSRRQARR